MFFVISMLLAEISFASMNDTAVQDNRDHLDDFRDLREVDILEKFYRGPESKDDNLVDISTSIRYKGQMPINMKLDSINTSDASNVTKSNLVLKDLWEHAVSYESLISFNLYDDIRLDIPVSFSFRGAINSKASNHLSTDSNVSFILERMLEVKSGFWLSWNAVSFFRMGVRGGKDDSLGYAISLLNSKYGSEDDKEAYSSDIGSFSMYIFGEFLISHSNWLRFEPEIRACMAVPNFRIGSGDYGNSTFDLGAKVLLPLKFAFLFLEDLRLKVIHSVESEMFFLGSDAVTKKGLKLAVKNSAQLEYELLDLIKLSIPLRVDYSQNFFNTSDKYIAPKIVFNTSPKVDLEWNFVDNLSLIADVALKYDFATFKVDESGNASFKFSTSMNITWDVGFKYIV